jgi:hypothetical protein
MLYMYIYSRISFIIIYLSLASFVSTANHSYMYQLRYGKTAVTRDQLFLLAVYKVIVPSMIVDVKHKVLCLLILSVTHTN